MKTLIIITALFGLLESTLGEANETHKACQAVMSCFQDAEDEIDKCLSILIGEKSAGTESPRELAKPSTDQGDCMTPIKDKIRQKKIMDQERVKDFKTCLNQRIDAGAEDVDPRKFRYCSTVTGRYQNKTAEAGNKKVKRQAQQFADLASASSNETLGAKNKSETSAESTSTIPLSSLSSLSLTGQTSGEPKNATSGGGLEPQPPLANSSSVEITNKPILPGELPPSTLPQSSESTLGQTQTGSQLGLSSVSHTQSTQQLSGLGQTETTLISTALNRTHSGLGQSTSGLSEVTSAKPTGELYVSSSSGQPALTSQGQLTLQEISSNSQSALTPASSHLPSTTESEYEESGGASSELGINPALPPKPSNNVPNPIVETLNLHNASEPLGPPLDETNATKPNEITTTQAAAAPTTVIGKVQPIGGAPGARSPGTRTNGHRVQKPIGAASDIDAGATDQDNQQRVKVEVLRETRRRLSEFKGCMARARIKREECKPLVRCCPDTAICHLNYESSDLHDKVHKLESEIVQGRRECIKQKRSKDELTDALDQIDAEELISDDSVVSQAIF